MATGLARCAVAGRLASVAASLTASCCVCVFMCVCVLCRQAGKPYAARPRVALSAAERHFINANLNWTVERTANYHPIEHLSH